MAAIALLLFHLAAGLGNQRTITQTYPFSVRSDYTLSRQIDSTEYVQGQNLTLAIQGNFTSTANKPIVGTPPTIIQRLTLNNTSQKITTSATSATFGGLAVNDDFIITPEVGSISVWYQGNYSLAQSNSVNGTVLCVSLWSLISSPVLAATSNYSGSLYLYLYVASLPDLTLYNSLETNLTAPVTGIYTSVYLNFLQTWVVTSTNSSDQVYVYRQTYNYGEYYTTINATTLGASSLDVVYIGYYESTTYICDASRGLYVIDVYGNSSLVEISEFGMILNGYLSGSQLTLTAQYGLVTIDLDTSQVLTTIARYLHQNETEALYAAPYLFSTNDLIFSYETSQVSGSLVTTLRAYTTTSSQPYVIFDEWIPAFLNNSFTESNPTPQFAYYNSVLIVNTVSTLVVFQVTVNPTIQMSSQSQAFNFNGYIYASNDEYLATASTYNFTYSGLNISNYAIYSGRGSTPADGYINTTANYGYIDHDQKFWVPLSNFFSGNNLTFTIDLTSNNSEVINQTFPDAEVDFLVYNQVSYNPVIDSAVFQGTIYLAVSPCLDYTAQVYLPNSSPYDVIQLVNSNSSFQVNNLALSTSSNSVLIIIQSVSQNVTTGNYTVLWDFYNLLSITSQPCYSYNFTSQSYPTKLEVYQFLLYAKTGDQILVFYLAFIAAPTYYYLAERTPISTDSVGFTFNPTDFVIAGSVMFIYDYSLGLLSTPAGAFVDSYTMTAYGVIDNKQNAEVELAYTEGVLFVMSSGDYPQVSILDIVGSDITARDFLPDLGTYTSLAANNNTVTVLCNNNQLLVFDPLTDSYDSLYMTINVASGTKTTGALGYLAFYSYNTITALSFTNLNVGASSDLVPSNSQSFTNWALVYVKPFKYDNKNYTVKFTITASNSSISKKSPVISVILQPLGDSIIVNSQYLFYGSALTSSSIDAYNNPQILIANDYFIGQNQTYLMVLNKNRTSSSEYITPSPSCVKAQPPGCIESKIYGLEQLPVQTVYALDFWQETLYISTDNSITTINSTSYNLTQVNSAYSTLCYKMKFVGNGLVAVACAEQLTASSETTSYVALMNLTQINMTVVSYVNMQVLGLDVDVDSLVLYAVDGFKVTAYNISASTYNLTYAAGADATSFGLNWFEPLSVSVIDSYQIVVGDEANGVVSLNLTSSGFSIVNSVIPTDLFTPLSTTTVTGVRASSGNVYASTSDGHLYTLNATTLQVTHTIWDAGSWVFTDSLRVVNQTAAVPVVYGSYIFLDIFNLTAPQQSALYTSYIIGPYYQANSISPIALATSSDTTLACATSTASVSIRLATYAYFYSQSTDDLVNSTSYNNYLVTLVSYSPYSSASYDPVSMTTTEAANFTGFTNQETSASDWNEVWIWILITLGAILASLGLSLLIIRLLPKKKQSEVSTDPKAEKLVMADESYRNSRTVNLV